MPAEQHEATMADVARKAGVSVSTVSRTLRGLSTVSPETRTRVERAARELSFAASRTASSLATGRTRRVAVLVPDLRVWFHGVALAGISAVLREDDLDLLVYTAATMPEREAFFERLPARRNADALLVLSFDLTGEERRRLDALGMPVVFVSQHAEGRASVYVDDVEAARRGTQHLLNLGHHRIAFLQSRGDSAFRWSATERLTGYRQAMREAGLPPDDSLETQAAADLPHALRETVGGLLSLHRPPTALFVDRDDMAIKVLGILRTAGFDVPGRMSVLGFDDHELAEALNLTTIAQPVLELGRAAAALVRSVIEDPDTHRRRHIVLPTHLIPRGSTAPPGRSDGQGAPADVPQLTTAPPRPPGPRG